MFASGCQRLASWARVGQACRGMARGLSSSMPPGEGKGLVRPDRERGLFALLGEGACSPETEPQKAALTSVVWEGGLRNTGPGGPAPRTPAPSGRQPPRADRRAGWACPFCHRGLHLHLGKIWVHSNRQPIYAGPGQHDLRRCTATSTESGRRNDLRRCTATNKGAQQGA